MSQKKPVALAIGATLAGGLMLSGSAFASTQLAQGYLLGAQDAGTTEKAKEGSCGVAAMDSDKDGKVSRAEFEAMHDGQGAMFDEIDTDKDGFMSADESKAHSEGRCGSDKNAKSGDKTGMEGKCGEGKCGGM